MMGKQAYKQNKHTGLILKEKGYNKTQNVMQSKIKTLESQNTDSIPFKNTASML
jgi:hypothetical protein